jgi:hypothetical protein
VPRPFTAGERSLLGGATLNFHYRLEVQNGSGTWKDLTNLGGKNWLDRITIDETLDQAPMALQFSVKGGDGAMTLNPLNGASTLNRDDANAYSPLLHPGRGVRVSEAVTLPGINPSTWRMIFLGFLDEFDSVEDGEQINLNGRDLFGRLLDTFIERRLTYGTAAGVPMETVIQDLLNDNGFSTTTLVLPNGSPSWMMRTFALEQQSLGQAIRDIAFQIGADIRYRWATGDTFPLQLYDPYRNNWGAGSPPAVADYTLPPSEYVALPSLRMGDRDVRNVIEVEFDNAVLKGVKDRIIVTDPGSIAIFGRRYMKLSEGRTSNIDTLLEASRMAYSALSDLSTPVADHAIQSLHIWFAQLGDIVDFPANTVHYDSTQQYAVVGIHREFSDGEGRIKLETRGKPSGAYRDWLRRKGSRTTPLGVPAPTFGLLIGEDSEGGGRSGDGKLWQEVTFDANTDFIDLFAEQSDTDDVPVPDMTEIVQVKRLIRPEGTEGQSPTWSTLVPMATTPFYWKRVRGYGGNREGAAGPEYISAGVQAKDVGTFLDGVINQLTVTYGPIDNSISVDVGAIDPVEPSFLVIMRNSEPIVKIFLGTTGNRVMGWVDTGVYLNTNAAGTAFKVFTYEAFIWTRGVTGKRAKHTQIAISAAAPVFTQGTPKAAFNAGTTMLQVSWSTTGVPGYTNIALEISSNGQTWSDVATSNLASGNWFLSNTSPAWYRLRAHGSVGMHRSGMVRWPGLTNPPGGQNSTNPPVFSIGVALRGGVPVLVISWTTANDSAVQVRIQKSPDNGVSPWVTVDTSGAVGAGSWDQGSFAEPTWYRMQALNAASAVLATSASQQYTPQ